MEFITIVEILVVLLVIVVTLYYRLARNNDYWLKRGLRGPRPLPIFGNQIDLLLQRVHASDFAKKLYDDYTNEPVIGLFLGRTPTLLLRDPDLIKDVLIKNFWTFADRGIPIHEDIDPLSQHLVFLEPKRWKPMRRKLTPVFTSGKLRDMFYLINDCARNFVLYLDKLAAKGEPIECREVCAKFTTDVIGVCAFGLNTNSMSDEDSEFRKFGRAIFDDSWFNFARRTIRSMPHWLAVLLKPIARNDRIIDFFVNVLKNTMDYRRRNNVRRNDFVDLLMDIKDHQEKIDDEEMTDILLTAQAFVFFNAGFETSSTTMSHVLYELAVNPDVQDKLRAEVNDVYEANNGKLNYDCIKNMTYMNKVLKETLRKYPPAATLPRKTLNDYTFANTGITITRNTRILIPVYALHHDKTIYPNPDKFDPERFEETNEAMKQRHPMYYLPFGDGPRNCIGARFAYNQMRVGLATAIRRYKFDVCEKTCKSYVKNVHSILLAPVGGLYLTIKKI